MEKKVSVLMCIYKEPLYWIKSAIESILQQTYLNLELILVLDDPENESAKNYILQLCKINKNIKLHCNTKNKGLVKSLNIGLGYCNGEFVARMDADDISYPTRIERQMIFLKEKRLDIIGCGVELFNDKYSHAKRVVSGHFCCSHNVKYYTCLSHPTWLGRREVFENLGGYREVDTCEDFDFLNRAVLSGYKIGNIPEVLFKYRLNPSSISHVKRYKQLATMRYLSKAFRKQVIPEIGEVNTYLYSPSCNEYINKLQNLFEPLKRPREELKCKQTIFKLKYNCEQFYIRKVTKLFFIIDFSNQKRAEFLRNIRPHLRNVKRKILLVRDLLYLKVRKDNNDPQKKIYVIGTEDYGNIGDQHIALSIIKYLEDHFSYKIVEVNASEYYNKRLWLLQHININDIIVMTGGGNFGNVYYGAQLIRRDIIHFWKNNLKIVMPVTIYYDTDEGMKFKKKDINYFTNYNNIILVSREEKSYEIAMESFSCKNILTPDIVLYSKYKSIERNKKSVLMCIRNDLESVLTYEDKFNIERELNLYFNNVQKIDTQLNYLIPRSERDSEVIKCIDYFRKAELVITDRLHGMIFSTITSTPCIVIGNYNHKVEGSYKWIEELEYIKYVSDVDKIPEILETRFWDHIYQYDPVKFYTLFDKIKIEIETLIK